MPLLDAEYIDSGKVRYVVHPFHFDRPGLALAVEAAWCAQDQSAFFEYQHALFERQGMSLDQTNLVNLAVEIGLDGDALVECLSSGVHRNDVAKARQAAASRGVTSTPTFFINNRRVVGNVPYAEFQSMIEKELAAAQ